MELNIVLKYSPDGATSCKTVVSISLTENTDHVKFPYGKTRNTDTTEIEGYKDELDKFQLIVDYFTGPVVDQSITYILKY